MQTPTAGNIVSVGVQFVPRPWFLSVAEAK